MAVAKANERVVKKHNYLAVGKRYLDHLLKQRRYEAAGSLCTKILTRDKKAWEEQVFRWEDIGTVKTGNVGFGGQCR